MKQNKAYAQSYFRNNLIENAGVLLGSCVYSFLYMLFFLSQIEEIRAYQEVYCLLDCYVLMMSPLFYLGMMSLPIIFTFLCCTKHDFMAMRITKYPSWDYILKMQEGKLLVYSVLYAGIFMGMIALFAHFSVKTDFNWNLEQSYFYMQAETTTSMSYVELLFFFFILCVLRNFVMQNLLLLSLWGKNNSIYGIAAIFGIAIFELNNPKIRLLFQLFSPNYYIWSRQFLRYRMLFGVPVYALLGWVVFRMILARQEVLGNEKI